MSNTPPIPPPKDDDAEDVFWALSTATTLYSRGEHAESLRWLRRAADQASDQNADGRAVELMKAAADLSAKVNVSAAPPAPRASTPPPLPKKAAPSIPAMPSRPPPPPPPRALPSPPNVPGAVASSAPIKPATRAARERHGTLTGRRVAARRGSSTDLGKVARPPGVPAEIPDTPVDDLDEETNVYEGKTKNAKGRKPISADAVSRPIAAPAALPASPPSKPRVVPAPPTSKPAVSVLPSTQRPSAMKVEPVPRRESTRPDPAKPSAAKLDVPVKSVTTGETPRTVASKAENPPKHVAAKVENIYPPKPAPTVESGALSASSKLEMGAPVARAATQRKGTMQLVDEGFESMLDAPEPPSVAVPIFVELPVPPPEEQRVEIVDVPVARAEPAKAAAQPVRLEPEPRAPHHEARALLAQRVAMIADSSGAVRVVLLDELASLPAGAVAGIVVPLSPDDGERLAMLLGGPKR